MQQEQERLNKLFRYQKRVKPAKQPKLRLVRIQRIEMPNGKVRTIKHFVKIK